MSPTSKNVDSLRNDMCEHVFDREDVSNTYKSNGYIEFYWRYMSPTSINIQYNTIQIFISAIKHTTMFIAYFSNIIYNENMKR